MVALFYASFMACEICTAEVQYCNTIILKYVFWYAYITFIHTLTVLPNIPMETDAGITIYLIYAIWFMRTWIWCTLINLCNENNLRIYLRKETSLMLYKYCLYCKSKCHVLPSQFTDWWLLKTESKALKYTPVLKWLFVLATPSANPQRTVYWFSKTNVHDLTWPYIFT